MAFVNLHSLGKEREIILYFLYMPGITSINLKVGSFAAVIITVLYEFLSEPAVLFLSTWNHRQAIFVIFIDINSWYPSTWGSTILYSDYSLLCMCYWLLHTCVRRDIFYAWNFFLPLKLFSYLLIIPAQLLFSSNLSNMTIQVLQGNNSDVVHKYPGTCFWNFANISASNKVSLCKCSS